MRTLHIAAVGFLSAVCLLVAPAGGQTPVTLQQAMDRPVDLTLEDAPIPEVFRRLTEKTGVKFVLDDATMACLPYGDQTRLAVHLTNVTLRAKLTAILAPLALQWSIEGDLVRIAPGEALARMCRRASYDELQVLGKLHTEKLAADKGATLDQLRKVTADKDLELVFPQGTADKAAALAHADRALPATGADWLDRLCQPASWTWYLWGDQVVLLDRKDQMKRQLQQQVSLRYQNEKLVTVLLDLARKARVTLAMEPGVLNYVPVETRNNFNLVMADAPIQQALEVISGATGLEFIRTDEGLRVAPSDKLAKAGPEPGARKTPFFVKFTMPGPHGTTLEVYLRPEELPEEFVKQIEEKKAEIFGTKTPPLTPPTTAPAGK